MSEQTGLPVNPPTPAAYNAGFFRDSSQPMPVDRTRQTLDWMSSQGFTLAEAFDSSLAIQGLLLGHSQRAHRAAADEALRAREAAWNVAYNRETSVLVGELHLELQRRVLDGLEGPDQFVESSGIRGQDSLVGAVVRAAAGAGSETCLVRDGGLEGDTTLADEPHLLDVQEPDPSDGLHESLPPLAVDSVSLVPTHDSSAEGGNPPTGVAP